MCIMATVGFIFNMSSGDCNATGLFLRCIINISVILKLGISFFRKNCIFNKKLEETKLIRIVLPLVIAAVKVVLP